MGTMERRIRREILDPDRPLSQSSLRSGQRRLLLRLTRLTRPRFQRPPRSEEAFPCRSLCLSLCFFFFALNQLQIGDGNYIRRVYFDFSWSNWVFPWLTCHSPIGAQRWTTCYGWRVEMWEGRASGREIWCVGEINKTLLGWTLGWNFYKFELVFFFIIIINFIFFYLCFILLK